MKTDELVNDFAIRSFRDIGDADYVAARMASRAGLVTPFLWAAQQAIEKYLKCILLLNRIPAKNIRHDLTIGLSAIQKSGKLSLGLTKVTEEFIERLDASGAFRYLEVSNIAFGAELVPLDRAVWELRRYCTRSDSPRKIRLREGYPARKISIPGGQLEKIIGDIRNPAREPLLWQNAFFGRRVRRRVKLKKWFHASNAPLSLHPEILDEVLKYVFLPKNLVAEYRRHKAP